MSAVNQGGQGISYSYTGADGKTYTIETWRKVGESNADFLARHAANIATAKAQFPE